MFWFVCRKIGLFPAILHRKNVFCQFAAIHFDFYLILLKTNVSVYFRVSYAVFRIHVWRNSLYLFSYINCAVNPLPYRKHVLGFWQLQWKLRALAHKRQQFGFSLQNTLLLLAFCWERRCNQLYSTTPYFGLFAVKLCCWQRYCTGKRFSSSLKQRFCLCLAKLQRFC